MTTSAERMRRWRQRHYDAGRHFIRGRLTEAPRRQRRPGEEPPHGTTARYQWRFGRCSCSDCRAANAAATAQRRRTNRTAP